MPSKARQKRVQRRVRHRLKQKLARTERQLVETALDFTLSSREAFDKHRELAKRRSMLRKQLHLPTKNLSPEKPLFRAQDACDGHLLLLASLITVLLPAMLSCV